jgi:bacterioferritin-associated ferredoxin
MAGLRANDVAKRSQLRHIISRSPGSAEAMYICLCNALTDRKVHAHGAGEACSVAMVYRALGVKPQCGKCVPYVRQMLLLEGETPAECPTGTGD